MWYNFYFSGVGDPFFFQSEILSLIIHRTTKNSGKHIFLSSSLFFFVVVLIVAIKVTRRRQIIKTSNKRSSVLQCLFVHRYHHPSLRRYEAVKITLLTREDVRLHNKKHRRRGTEEKR